MPSGVVRSTPNREPTDRQARHHEHVVVRQVVRWVGVQHLHGESPAGCGRTQANGPTRLAYAEPCRNAPDSTTDSTFRSSSSTVGADRSPRPGSVPVSPTARRRRPHRDRRRSARARRGAQAARPGRLRRPRPRVFEAIDERPADAAVDAVGFSLGALTLLRAAIGRPDTLPPAGARRHRPQRVRARRRRRRDASSPRSRTAATTRRQPSPAVRPVRPPVRQRPGRARRDHEAARRAHAPTRPTSPRSHAGPGRGRRRTTSSCPPIDSSTRCPNARLAMSCAEPITSRRPNRSTSSTPRSSSSMRSPADVG